MPTPCSWVTNRSRSWDTRGFTLLELSIVVVLTALLLTLIFPVYEQQARASRRALGGAALFEVRARQEQFFIDHKRYAQDLVELGYEATQVDIDRRGKFIPVTVDGGIYRIELSAGAQGYTVSARPLARQEADHECAVLSLSEAGLQSSSGKSGASCW